MKISSWSRFLTPERMLLGSFTVMILAGTVLLKLPFCTVSGSIRTIDALFTATSAVCVTGLVVLDTGKDFSLTGQLVILTLIQLGGLGIMTFSVLFWNLLGRDISLRGKMALESSLSYSPLRDVFSLAKQVILIAFSFEAIGALLLLLRWSKFFPLQRAFYLSIFHSVSAFCNAGFSPLSDSLSSFRGDWAVNLVVSSLIVLGGIGFIVIIEIKDRFLKGRRLSLHTKVVLVTTLVLVLTGALLIGVMERGNVLQGKPFGEKVLVSLFHSISARTAGFSTVEIGKMGDAALFLLIILMFIGASPGSCGGGVKTTNLAILFSLAYNRLRGRNEAIMFRRTVPSETVIRSISLIMGSFLFLSLMLFLLLIFHGGGSPQGGTFIELLFELTSAFGTVGLSTGLTPTLTDVGKIILIVTMLVGRLGLLTTAYALARRVREPVFRYAEENIMVG